MVFYFTPCDDRYLLYMGEDKFENEDLIKYGLPTDVWFHVDNLSSAHVYLRMPEEESIETIPDLVMEDCCQLVKDNSIKGRKEISLQIVYTPWENLLKKGNMAVGQVGFKKQKAALLRKVTKENIVVNRLNRTKREEHPDFAAIRARYDVEQKRKNDQLKRDLKAKKKQEEKEWLKKKEMQSYSDIMTYDQMESNQELDMTAEEYEDSFM